MVFARVSLLQKNSPPLVDHEDRERAMQLTLKMDRLLGRAHGPVAFVDQDQRSSDPALHSVTRLAALALRRWRVLATFDHESVWVRD